MNIALIYTETDLLALGMRSVSSVLKKAGHQTRLILMGSEQKNYSSRTFEEIKELVKHSDVTGISSFSRSSDKARHIIENLKSLDKLIVWGGIHAILNPEECAEHADLVCRGEGEDFMLDLMERIEHKKNWRGIANGAYKNNGGVVFNDLRPLISDLDQLPVIDYSHDDEFHLKKNGFVQVYTISDGTEPVTFNGTRGCAFQCNYCSNAKLKQLFSGHGRYVRKMSVSKYIEHAKTCKESFPNSKYFYFADEDFFARPTSEIREFSEEYPKQTGLPFQCMASPLQINKDKFELLVKAGLWRIDMGIESGSERTKKEIYNRPMSNKAVMRAAHVINKYPQVVPYYFLIIGNPYEERGDLLETIRFLSDLPHPYYLRTYDLVFLPGTLLYEHAIRDGIIEGKQSSGYELDFLDGLNYKKHNWKKKNLYLNGLLYLMAGKSTHFRMGLIPRAFFELLLNPGIIDFNERHTILIRTMIFFKRCTLKQRGHIAYLLKKLFRDPTSVYNLRGFLKARLIEN